MCECGVCVRILVCVVHVTCMCCLFSRLKSFTPAVLVQPSPETPLLPGPQDAPTQPKV